MSSWKGSFLPLLNRHSLVWLRVNELTETEELFLISLDTSLLFRDFISFSPVEKRRSEIHPSFCEGYKNRENIALAFKEPWFFQGKSGKLVNKQFTALGNSYLSHES